MLCIPTILYALCLFLHQRGVAANKSLSDHIMNKNCPARFTISHFGEK
jgi:hypothetical protein